MKQRVVIAIALACRPKLIIADEPTTALDVTIQAQVMNLIKELKEKFGTSMILITHDLGIVAEICDKVAIMYAGQIVEYASVEKVYNIRAIRIQTGCSTPFRSLIRRKSGLRKFMVYLRSRRSRSKVVHSVLVVQIVWKSVNIKNQASPI